MNLEHLMNNGKLFAYETSKYFANPERLLRHYKCEQEIVVLSTKRIYIYYCITHIDVKDEALSILTINRVDDIQCLVSIRNKEFHLVFESKDELDSLIDYYNEYK